MIGRDGGLPWRLRTDLQRFKALTVGKPCVMGRATWDSLPLKPLPGRLNIVLSRDLSYEVKGAVVVAGLDEALEMAREQAEEDGADEICVIGGVAVFQAALPRARRIHLTEVQADPEGDVSLPPFDPAVWRETAAEPVAAGDRDDHDMVFRTLERR